MNNKRADLIRRHWMAYRHLSEDFLLRSGDAFRCPIRQSMPDAVQHYDDVMTAPIEVLEFRLEYSSREGIKLYRIVCESVDVESGRRPRWR